MGDSGQLHNCEVPPLCHYRFIVAGEDITVYFVATAAVFCNRALLHDDDNHDTPTGNSHTMIVLADSELLAWELITYRI